MPTILDTLKKGTEYLEKHGIDEARLNMEHLIAHTLKVERMQLYLDFDRPLTEEQLESLRDLTKRRSRSEPLQHLMGTVEFCGLEFATDSRALIPRPETEELADILTKRKWSERASILDMGCGSGVLGLTLAHHLKGSEAVVTLVDISEEALDLARENASSLDLGAQVHFARSDLFSEVDGEFDLIMANLPYIPAQEETKLSREVQRDPAVALYGGDEGTELIKAFLKDVLIHLKPGGHLAIEYGIGQAEELKLDGENAGLSNVVIRKDLSGIERYIFATKSA
tara:strand:- start:1361 stop:2209 length:849 start_codon:yes stop_codon:yes gene_type:complete